MAPLLVEAAGVAVAVERQRRPAAQLDLSHDQLAAECQSVARSALQVDESVEALRHGIFLGHGHELDQSSQSFTG